MTSDIVQTPQNATLIGAGPVKKEVFYEALELAPLLVAADAGAEMARKYGKTPDFVVGDMDSVKESGLQGLSPGKVIRITEQDSTDFDKSLRFLESPLVVGVGFLGGRLDHQLAVLHGLARRRDRRIILLGDEDVIFRVPSTFRMPLAQGIRVSLYPYSDVQAKSEGLRWPLDGLDMSPTGIFSQSNEATGPELVLSPEGDLLAFLPRQELAAVAAALTLSRQTT